MHNLVIADIETPVIIGFDFIYEHDCYVKARECAMYIGGKCVSCILETQLNATYRIRLDSSVSVPPMSEMIIPAKIENKSNIFPHVSGFLIVPDPESYLN
jgi:hypothetical protein